MDRAWVRRPITIGGVVLALVVLVGTLPIWILLAPLFDLVRAKFRLPTLRLLGFALCWCVLEVCGVIASFAMFLVGQARNRRAHYALQRWWAKNLIRSLRLTCGLRIEVEGVDAFGDGPLVCFGRHASLGDALVSAWIMGSLARRFPRYVMKRELLLDPCLDIVGQRIPNYFVDRGSAAVRQEIAGIRAMAEGMGGRDVAVIFPEGTRASSDKRTYLVDRLERRQPERHVLFQELRYLLPPRPAGAVALLEAVPDADVTFMGHVGFDGLDTFGGILRRLAYPEPTAVVSFHTVARSEVPTGEAFGPWLDAEWLALDRRVAIADAARGAQSA